MPEADMLSIEMTIYGDPDWENQYDPAWIHRPSLHEMQIASALDLAYEMAEGRERQTELMHQIVTRAIASMVPVDDVSNRELAHILFGSAEQENKRAIRQFRNEERPLKLSKAAVYIQQLIHAEKIPPGEGGRLWYVSLLYASAIAVIADYVRGRNDIDLLTFKGDHPVLIEEACSQYQEIMQASVIKTNKLPLKGYPLNEVSKYMDFSAFINWQESRLKRNPMVGIRRLIDITQIFNKYKFPY